MWGRGKTLVTVYHLIQLLTTSQAENLKQTLDGLTGTLTISCAAPSSGSSTTCGFQQAILNSLFGSSGLQLTDCIFGECVAQNVIDETSSDGSTQENIHKSLSGGVIAGLAVVGGLIALALGFLALGYASQRKARRLGPGEGRFAKSGGVAISWQDVSYIVPASGTKLFLRRRNKKAESGFTDEKVVLDNVSGRVEPGQMMAILGPSGAGKTTLVEILAGKQKVGHVSGSVSTPSASQYEPRIAFVPQQDVLPATLSVREALTFAANLRMPESVPKHTKAERVEKIVQQLGLERVADTRIGSGERRGVSGGEMRRVSIGLELVGRPDVLILDEPTSGLDSVSAQRVASVLWEVAHDAENPTAVLCSIHQPSSKLYHTFDQLLVLSHGRALYSGPGGLAPANHFTSHGVESPPEGYNIADYLLDVASDPPPALFGSSSVQTKRSTGSARDLREKEPESTLTIRAEHELTLTSDPLELEKGVAMNGQGVQKRRRWGGQSYATTFLTQFEVLAGREWKILTRYDFHLLFLGVF